MYAYNPKSVLGPIGAVAPGQNIIDNVDIVVKAGAAFTLGDVVSIATILTVGDNGVSLTGYSAESGSAAAAAAVDSDIRTRKFLGVALETVASDATMRVRVKGVVAANLASNPGVMAPIAVTASKQLGTVVAYGTPTKNCVVAAYPLETGTGVKKVIFDGIQGFGSASIP